jgi:hypothetical protein
MSAPRCQGDRCPACGASAKSLASEMGERIARRYGYELHELQAPGQKRDAVTVRKLIACVLREAGFSLPVIACVLNRDHSTVLHGLKQVERALEAGVGSALPRPPHALAGALHGRRG